MKKILLILSALLLASTAHADTCSANLTGAFVPAQATAICSKGFSTGTAKVGGLNFPSTTFETVAGAGTTVADAAALSATKHTHQITGADGVKGWKFASATIGQVEILLNTTAGVAKVYAVSGGTCNGGSADTACTLVTGIAPHICYATAANAWICG